MPRVFRIMKKDVDDLPTVSSISLGVRPGIDVDLDSQGHVLANGKGMSVAPTWRVINVTRIPRRLRGIVPGAGGSNSTFCFRMGEGDFAAGEIASGLMLVPDSTTHGNVAPIASVPFSTYESDLAATRAAWQIEET